MTTIAERARDVRHKVAEAALEAGVQWSYGLDYELDAILRDALLAERTQARQVLQQLHAVVMESYTAEDATPLHEALLPLLVAALGE